MRTSLLISSRPQRQRGAATLIVTLVLFFVLAMTVAFANRNLVFEHRASANQARATLAFEAAEAGLEWAQAQLNNGHAMDEDCLPQTTDTSSTATTFRQRYLSYDPATHAQQPRVWNDDGRSAALQPTCVRSDNGWSCHCPVDGPPVLDPPEDSRPRPAFTVQLAAHAQPGLVTVVSTGCTQLAGACLPGSEGRSDATARVEATFALVGGLRMPPAAPLTAQGEINLPAMRASNDDMASVGLAVHAGGDIHAEAMQVQGLAGAPSSQALVDNDAALHAMPAERFFSAHFGLDKLSWTSQGRVSRVACSPSCTGNMNRDMVYIDGNLHLDSSTPLGTATHPVLLVVNGALEISGPAVIHGAVYARSLRCSGSGTVLNGALMAEGDITGSGTPQFLYDRDVLDRLVFNTGSFVRMPGSWRDF
jgi:hypothetical protein